MSIWSRWHSGGGRKDSELFGSLERKFLCDIAIPFHCPRGKKTSPISSLHLEMYKILKVGLFTLAQIRNNSISINRGMAFLIVKQN